MDVVFGDLRQRLRRCVGLETEVADNAEDEFCLFAGVGAAAHGSAERADCAFGVWGAERVDGSVDLFLGETVRSVVAHDVSGPCKSGREARLQVGLVS